MVICYIKKLSLLICAMAVQKISGGEERKMKTERIKKELLVT